MANASSFIKVKLTAVLTYGIAVIFMLIIQLIGEKIVSNYVNSSAAPVEMTIILRYIYRG